jgi:hypothetical protein
MAAQFTSLEQFGNDSTFYSSLLDVSGQIIPLSPDDVERLYSLCDYGTLSTKPKFDASKSMTAISVMPMGTTLEPVRSTEHYSIAFDNSHQHTSYEITAADDAIGGLSAATLDLGWDRSYWGDG